MLKEEKYIRKHFGKSSGFKVPEGYFDSVSSRILASLPQAKPQQAQIVIGNQNFWSRHRRMIASVAAGICVVLLPLGAYLHLSDGQQSASVSAQAQVMETQNHASSNIDAFMEYSMMDTNDMYSYIADAR